jgi:hypothetical protein
LFLFGVATRLLPLETLWRSNSGVSILLFDLLVLVDELFVLSSKTPESVLWTEVPDFNRSTVLFDLKLFLDSVLSGTMSFTLDLELALTGASEFSFTLSLLELAWKFLTLSLADGTRLEVFPGVDGGGATATTALLDPQPMIMHC